MVEIVLGDSGGIVEVRFSSEEEASLFLSELAVMTPKSLDALDGVVKVLDGQ